MSSFTVASTLEKLGKDKDFRFMAMSDLLAEMAKETFKLDADGERKLVPVLLTKLDDVSKDVQQLALKCLPVLVSIVSENTLELILETLCNNVIRGKEELRDISSLGLTNILSEISAASNSVASLVKKVPQKLIGAISSTEPDVAMRALEVFCALLTRFGGQVPTFYKPIQDSVLPQLANARATVRKWAVNCVGLLAAATSDKYFAEIVADIAARLRRNDNTRTLVQCVGTISRFVGYRLGPQIGSLMELILSKCGDAEDRGQDEESIEITENCLLTFESFIMRCPKEVGGYLPQIVKQCVDFIKFDPNLASNDSGEDDAMEDDEEDEDDGSDQSNDEDMSWKVRKAAAKCLCAVITTRPDALGTMYQDVAPVLIGRFKEREENVKGDIFNTFSELLRQTSQVSKIGTNSGATDTLRQMIPNIVRASTKQLKAKSLKTRAGAFSVLQELISVIPGCLTDHLAVVVPATLPSLSDKIGDNNLKMRVLKFLRSLLTSHEPTAFQPHVKAIVPPLIKLVEDTYYKTSADALRVVGDLVRVLRPGIDGCPASLRNEAVVLYRATLNKLAGQDIDQEVKQNAIRSIGTIIALLGDELQSELGNCLPLLLERVRNEITRLTTIRAITQIAKSPLRINMSAILSPVLEELASFLRKTNRSLKQSSLVCLEALVTAYGSEMKDGLLADVLRAAAHLISDEDLQLAHLSLVLCDAALRVQPRAIQLLQEQILPLVLRLSRSSLLQGNALESVILFFTQMVSAVGYDELLQQLLAAVLRPTADAPAFSKQALASISQCVAALTVQAPEAARDRTVASFIGNVKNPSSEQVKLISLLCIGEIGHRLDLQSHRDLESTILDAFQSASEEGKSAASFALGNLAVGNMQKYVPFIIEEISKQSKRQYQLLHSLKEIISRQSGRPGGLVQISPFMESIWNMLFQHCESEEEGTRNLVAECLGKLALMNPTTVVPVLVARLGNSTPLTRSTLVSAVRFTVSDKVQPIDAVIAPHIPTFLNLLGDSDLLVRRATLLTMNFAAHHKPALVRDYLPTVLPLVYRETPIKEELIRIVTLGPFKHKVDDGIENRKAAFELMYTLLETALDRVDMHDFMVCAANGLKDTEFEIKMQCHLILIRAATVAGASLLEALDNFVEPLKTTVGTKLKENAVKQDVERNEDLIHSALRATYYLSQIPNSGTCLKFDEYLRNDVKTAHTEVYRKIVSDIESSGRRDDMDTTG